MLTLFLILYPTLCQPIQMKTKKIPSVCFWIFYIPQYNMNKIYLNLLKSSPPINSFALGAWPWNLAFEKSNPGFCKYIHSELGKPSDVSQCSIKTKPVSDSTSIWKRSNRIAWRSFSSSICERCSTFFMTEAQTTPRSAFWENRDGVRQQPQIRRGDKCILSW